jgi:hypothetical protein
LRQLSANCCRTVTMTPNTSLWWWALIDSVGEIEAKGVKDESLVKAYVKPTLSTPIRERFDKAGKPLPQTDEGR